MVAHCLQFPVVDANAPAFWLVENGKYVPLTYKKLLSFLKFLLRSSGRESDNVGLHSLRRSGSAFMYDIGFGIDDIRQVGDWQPWFI